MLVSIQSLADIKNWIMVEIAGSANVDEAYFEVPLNDEEIQNIVDRTLRDFFNWAYDGVQEGVMVLDTIQGQTTYDIPHNIFQVTMEYAQTDTKGGTSIGIMDFIRSPVIYVGGNQVYGGGLGTSLLSFYAQQNVTISNLNFLFKPLGQHRFNWYNHTMTLFSPATTSGQRLFKCYFSEDLDVGATGITTGEIFNEPIVRDLILTRCRKKVGWTGKYMKPITVGNYTLDFSEMYNDAVTAEKELMEKLEGQSNVGIILIG